MEAEQFINKAMFWLEEQSLISPESAPHVRRYLGYAYAAGAQEQRRIDQAHNLRKVAMFDRHGRKLGEFNSLTEAAKGAGYGKRYRGGYPIVLNVLSGRHPYTKEGYVFKYIEDESHPDNSRGNMD